MSSGALHRPKPTSLRVSPACCLHIFAMPLRVTMNWLSHSVTRLSSWLFSSWIFRADHPPQHPTIINMGQQNPPQGGSRKISFNVSDQYEIQDVIGEGAYGVVW